MKKKATIATVLIVALIIITGAASAAYSGPDRKPAGGGYVVKNPQGEWQCSWPGAWGYPPCHSSCQSHCSVPGNWVDNQTTPPEPEAQANSTTTCSLPGGGGWCRGDLYVTLTGRERLSGHVITHIEGEINAGSWEVLCDPPNGSNVSCAWPDEGVSAPDSFNALSIWACSSKGDTSRRHNLALYRDSTPPHASFVFPDVAVKTVLLEGQLTDTASGVDADSVEIGLPLKNSDVTWQPVIPDGEGNWQYSWDTTKAPGGAQQVVLRAADVAGNVTEWRLPVTVANTKPRVELSERWYIWERGWLKVYAGDVPIREVRIAFSDPADRFIAQERSFRSGWKPVTLHSGDDALAWDTHIHWDRRFADGIVAPVGEYGVSVTAYDSVGHHATAYGVIVIPAPPTPTHTPTAAPSVTRPPTQEERALPTRPVLTATQTATATPTPAIEAAPFQEAAKSNLLSLVLLASIGLLLVFSTSAVLDRRPHELNRINRLIEKSKGEQ